MRLTADIARVDELQQTQFGAERRTGTDRGDRQFGAAAPLAALLDYRPNQLPTLQAHTLPSVRHGNGIVGHGVFTAPIFGPIVGGVIADNLSWPWIFCINVPIGLLSALTIWSMLRKRDTKCVCIPIDVVGLSLRSPPARSMLR